jgi:predicted peptidase
MIKKLLLIAFLFCSLCGHSFATKGERPLKKVRYNYLTYLPENYDSTQAKLYPVILYLHGRSASGTDLNKVRRYGLPFFLDRGKKLDFIVVAPQCPWGKRWSSEDWIDTLLLELNTQYHVDNDRIYLTGMSLGGFGTWELANKYPHLFAAIAPMCGGGKTEWADNICHLPTWVFHGVQDRLVPVLRSDQMVKALEAHHALIKYDRLTKKGHDLHRLFDNDELYQWFACFTRRPIDEDNPLSPIEPLRIGEFKTSTLPAANRLAFPHGYYGTF